ncbi:MAG: DUF502 domain-containing protein [Deltaproteobacteria bacterium]|nr:DUF502 domain-containing protein [Deltaproteobacteria bacterium]
MGKKIKKIFLTGILVIIPVSLTAYILFIILKVVRKLVSVVPPALNPDTYLPFYVPGFGGFVVTVALIFIVGLVTKSFVGRKLMELGEAIVDQIPFVRNIYKGAKQLTEAILGDKSGSFKKVALIEFPRAGMYALGFVTGVAQGEIQEKTEQRVLNIFVPTTPNPTSGFYLMIPEENVIMLDMTVEEAFTLLISGGIIAPPEQRSLGSRSSYFQRGEKKC